jgi:SAM-dependent methyltransferase
LISTLEAFELATAHPDAMDIHYLLGDFLAYPFERESFDLITSVAALHHMNAAAAFERIRDLLRPDGVVAILGLARRRFPADLPFDLAGVLVSRFHRLTRTYWEPPHRQSGHHLSHSRLCASLLLVFSPGPATAGTSCGAIP